MSNHKFKQGDRCRIVIEHPSSNVPGNVPAGVGDIVILGEPYYYPNATFHGWFLRDYTDVFYWKEDWLEFIGHEKTGFGQFINRIENGKR